MSDPSEVRTSRHLANEPAESRIEAEAIAGALTLAGLRFTDDEIELMLPGVNVSLENYELARTVSIANSVPPAWHFDPRPPAAAPAATRPPRPLQTLPAPLPPLPDDLEEIAFWPVSLLSSLIHSRQITSVVLTDIYLDRLKRIGPELECVVTLTEDLATRTGPARRPRNRSGLLSRPPAWHPLGRKGPACHEGISPLPGVQRPIVIRFRTWTPPSCSGWNRPARCWWRSSPWARLRGATSGSAGARAAHGIRRKAPAAPRQVRGRRRRPV